MHIPELPFRVPVTVRLSDSLEHTFHSVFNALDFLEHEWPLRKGSQYLQAVQQCRAALANMVSPEIAREAFIAACIEAGMPPITPGSVTFDMSSKVRAAISA